MTRPSPLYLSLPTDGSVHSDAPHAPHAHTAPSRWKAVVGESADLYGNPLPQRFPRFSGSSLNGRSRFMQKEDRSVSLKISRSVSRLPSGLSAFVRPKNEPCPLTRHVLQMKKKQTHPSVQSNTRSAMQKCKKNT